MRVAGRQPGEVRRTAMTLAFFGKDRAALERKLDSAARLWPALAGQPLADQVSLLRQSEALVGGAEELVEQIGAYAAAGVEELMLQWLDMDDIDGLRAFAEQVLPRVG